MKNPLRKRLLRELRDEAGKYAVIFLLLVATIGFVSGFLVADGSMRTIYDESFEKYNIEDGYFDVKSEMTAEEKSAIEENGITVYENYFKEEALTNNSTLRIYRNREDVDRVCLMEGEFPKKTGEIAVDRMYAENNEIEVGDTLKSDDREWKVTGLVALSDYSCLFSNNNDTMFDAVKFGVAVVTDDEFNTFSRKTLRYRYAWTYDAKPADEQEENNRAEDLMKAMGKTVTLESFVPQYQNQAIKFTGEDMGSDKAMMTVLLYMIIGILAFVFGITISNTISKEANTIGTLRASGYTRAELVRHYLSLPLIVTATGALLGNVLGYTMMKNVVCGMYYGSYSLTKYETIWSGEAFLKTTVVPFFMMLLINLLILNYKMKLSPLKFIRRDLSRRKQKHAVRLSVRCPFFARFRMRIILQNMSNYAILLVGITFANLLLLFGLALPVVLDHYQEEVEQNMLSSYQYMLSVPVSIMSDDSKLRSMLSMLEFSKSVETDNKDAEKFSVYSLDTTDGPCDSEEILLYGIEDGSHYIPLDVSGSQVYISKGYADKYRLGAGDKITLKEKYKGGEYTFTITGVYDYMGSLSLFMNQQRLNKTFDLDDDYFSGYFSDTEITDINEKYIGSVVDLDALTKVSRQLDVSMGSMMYLVDGFAILIFLVLIYLLSKIVIEKNGQSISMVKILGYGNGEICRLYILSTSIMVVIFLLLSMAIDYELIKVIYRVMMMESISGWIEFYINRAVFVKMFGLGIVAYAVVAVLEVRKIRRVPMDEALKNVE
ncbi:ABC transporter permease [Hespellia stercorisuis]|uniref:Putative ABC transport system permease protein n=1 Tax=Hespellia stercorisuis DSM 15480 TaxID=1121950 RepID=A0A1M6UTA6_9FIRM|nr:FtsX-like permease family protein [Hespellia stercorisuis]SHK72373.1 putative ABC transport system permease protein [Hespellia stercorisuis DSM 15480]